VLAGSEEFINKSWRVKQRLGGAMRQSGVLAAMCLYALDNNISRLSNDHEVASFLGSELEKLETVEQILPIETNIVIFDLSDETISAPNLVQKMGEQGFQIGAFGERRIRIVTHLDVDMAAGIKLVEALKIYLK
jgi:threonine aldolase